jgi:hypothetical protein
MSMPSQREPKVGDKYLPLFQSDLDDRLNDEVGPLTISEVHYQCDDGQTWSITASDDVGYDAVWSDRHQVWCYNLE